jgi:hypothetical protein
MDVSPNRSRNAREPSGFFLGGQARALGWHRSRDLLLFFFFALVRR